MLVLLAAVSWGHAQNLLSNGSFENGVTGMGWGTNIEDWAASELYGGDLVASAEAYDGSNLVEINAQGNWTPLLWQYWPATAGKLYEVDGQLRSPGGPDYFQPTNGYVMLVMQYYDASNAKIGQNFESVHFADSGPTTWTKYTTGPAVAPAGTVSGRTIAIYLGSGDLTTSGIVEMDDLQAYETTPDQAGAILNPSFEIQSSDNTFTNIPYWIPFGNAGASVTNYARTGRRSMQVWYTENLIGQTWAATGGTRYATAGYAYTPSSEPLSGTNAHGVILLQYLNSAGTVLATYETAYVTNGGPQDTWIKLEAEGVAPSGTVTGRTMCAILGADSTISGSVFFDDITQHVAGVSETVAGEISNPGFDDGITGNAAYLSNDLPHWTWYGGTNAGFITGDQDQDGGQSLVIVYPGNLMGQDFAATTGMEYVVEGYMYHPSSDPVTSTTAYATFLLEFFNPVGDTVSVSVVSTDVLTKDTPTDSWIKFSVTNRAPWVGPVTGRVSCAVLDLEGTPYGGSVYFDSLAVYERTNWISNSSSGELENPGFEYTANGTKLPYIDNWEALGLEGSVDSSYSRSGDNSLKIPYFETLLAQYWPAEPGYTYSSEGYAFTPSGTDNFTTSTNAHAVLLLQYLNNTGGVVATYESEYFTGSATAGTWSNLFAQGKAPSSTVTGRTVCAILGPDDAFAGAVWFDDLTQDTVSSVTTTTAGMVTNPGFEDGFAGNANYLSNDLPAWTWYGGTNAGFIVDDVSYEGDQSAVIVFPNNLLGQDFAAVTGMEYVVEGYMYHPSTDPMTSTTAYATFLLEFFNPAGDTVSVSVVSTDTLTKDTPTDSWIKFSVTNRAPWVGPVTGRVSCAVLDLEGTPYGGSIYFDSVAVYERTNWISNSSSGALENPGFEFTANGTKLQYIDDWEGLGFDGSVASGYSRSGDKALTITYPETLLAQYWDASVGYKYSTECYVSTPSGANQLTTTTNAQALLLLQYLNDTGGVIITYQSDPFTGSATPDTWSNLQVRGVAPYGTVTGRTVCALLGLDEGFGGAVYFDDAGQVLVSTTPSTSGFLTNPGFDDGPTGNAYDLDPLGDLPGWNWFGGDNAGFIGRDYQYDGEQCAILTYPQNSFGHDWTAESGKTYKAEGYLFTPSGADRFTSDGSSYGQLVMSFYVNGDTNPVEEAIFDSADFTKDATAGQWTYFAVTGTAPEVGIVTGRLACVIESPNPAGDWELGGIICFDGMNLVEVSGGLSDFAQWQLDNFGSTNAPNTGEYEDYDLDGFLNYYEFIAGTFPTNAGSFLAGTMEENLGGDEVVIRWPGVAGRYYAVSATTNILTGTFSMLASNIAAVLPETVYTDTPPSSVEGYYYRISVRTNQF